MKDRLKFLSPSPGNADLQVQFLDRLKRILLLYGAVRFVFQERIPTMFEFIMLLDLASANLINRFVEILDQVKVIMD